MHAESLIKPRYAALDGLRGIAILMVFFNHFGRMFMPARYAQMLWPGVDIFFVLSGFLITGILYNSKGSDGYFRNFYIRRGLRIFPLYYGFFLLLAIFTPVLHLRYDRSIWWHLLYIANLTRMHPYVHNPTIFYWHNTVIGLGTLWSLCVEEQFYLVWPFLIWAMPSRKAAMRFCAVAVFFTVCLRSAVYLTHRAEVADIHFLYFVTYARCDALFLGAWLALWLRGVELTAATVRRISYSLIASGSIILIAGAKLIGHRWPENDVNPLLCTYGYTVIDLVAFGILLLAIDERTGLHRMLRNKPLAKLGKISYGFYFFHAFLLGRLYEINFRHFSPHHLGFVLAILCFASTYALAWLSYRFYESPILKLKDRLAPL